jgi:hypothetical protein
MRYTTIFYQLPIYDTADNVQKRPSRICVWGGVGAFLERCMSILATVPANNAAARRNQVLFVSLPGGSQK